MNLRLSYSILASWANGDHQFALDMLYWQQPPPSEAMQAGRDYHENWEQEVKAHKALPKVFGSTPLKSPLTEKATKAERQLNDWLVLSGRLDVLDGDLGIDFKTGTASIGKFTGGYQHKVYQILYPHLKHFEYHLYNQYTKEASMAIVHLSPKTLREGLEFVLTQACDIRAYLEQNELSEPPTRANSGGKK